MSHRGKKKEKRPLSSDDSDSGPDDRGPAPKGAKSSKADSNPYKKAETSKPKSSGSRGQEEPSWDLGKNKWVKVREFKGQTYIDIREYYVDKETMETRPGKKGISLNCQQYQKLKVPLFCACIDFNDSFYSQSSTKSITSFLKHIPGPVFLSVSPHQKISCDKKVSLSSTLMYLSYF